MAIAAAACATAPPVEEVPSAEGYYRRALELLEGSRSFLFFRDVNYPRVIELFQEIIDNYPYSRYATLAELKIADVHFDRKRYEEAASYFQDFVELHPSHEQVPYAIFRNGLCSFRRMRGVDQDQTPTQEAIAQFQVLLDRYPDSEYAELAGRRLQEAIDHLASHDIEVGAFYYGRGDYHAAARRFRQALVSYPEHSAHLQTMLLLASALRRTRHFDEAENVLQRALAAGGENGLDEDTRERLSALGQELTEARRRAEQRSCLADPLAHCPSTISEER